ncbi:HAD family hydrolase [Marinomonas spartinae]|uniref:HAD family hydrolase n=1 Tax=Marinomonas spartinae TaxID=1792290 RepID=UPI0018F1F244|nr:HAD-IA family hydrolase [Marinomonas spartinae]MBJ7555538.1 HAD-IA family hydrolase [Marinomonas spartinae]
MKNTVLIDFDGVIRHWSSAGLDKHAASLGLERNPLFACAFSERHLQPAITGEISHEEWCDNVRFDLSKEYGQGVAGELVNKWYSLEAEIDYEFLTKIRSHLSLGQLVLVTNATSRLNDDLHFVGLDSEFDQVINSSEIGVAKPALNYFYIALKKLGVSEDECVFIDDSAKNVKAARSLGIESLLHSNTQETLKFIEEKCA